MFWAKNNFFVPNSLLYKNTTRLTEVLKNIEESRVRDRERFECTCIAWAHTGFSSSGSLKVFVSQQAMMILKDVPSSSPMVKLSQNLVTDNSCCNNNSVVSSCRMSFVRLRESQNSTRGRGSSSSSSSSSSLLVTKTPLLIHEGRR